MSSLFKIQGLHTARRNSLLQTEAFWQEGLKPETLTVISSAYFSNSREMDRKNHFYNVPAKGRDNFLLSALKNFQDTQYFNYIQI